MLDRERCPGNRIAYRVIGTLSRGPDQLNQFVNVCGHDVLFLPLKTPDIETMFLQTASQYCAKTRQQSSIEDCTKIAMESNKRVVVY
jgi:hypothetical protein